MLGVDFWSSGPLHILLGLAIGLPLVFWDWRAMLLGLLFVQFAVGRIMGAVYGLPSPWPEVHFAVLFLACLILLLSILQTENVRVNHAGQFSSFLFRLLILGMAALLVWRVGGNISLPLLNEATKLLFLWLLVLAVLTLGLTETVLFAGAALLLWLVPLQALLSVLFPVPAFIILLGVLALLVALVCSYLLLAEDDALASALQPADLERDILPTVRPQPSIAAGAKTLWHDIAYRISSLLKRMHAGIRSS